MLSTAPLLDLLSTSQKTPDVLPLFCSYGAPYIATVNGKSATISQACCNHWDCPKCFTKMAAQHKFRMCNGAAQLAEQGHDLYFWTLTCRGKDLDMRTADDDYYMWTNRLLSSCRYHAKRDSKAMHYVQVTERQQRGAAHSHLICTWFPDDQRTCLSRPDAKTGEERAVCVSNWFHGAVVKAGLGTEWETTVINSPTAVAAYISGYLQKHVRQDKWPPKWKRIRYSREWPKSPQGEAATSRVLISPADWRSLCFDVPFWTTNDMAAYEVARRRNPFIRMID